MTGVAELGVIASIIQIADVGLKLSTKLYGFAGTVASADSTIASISRDVEITSTVLVDLGETLKKDSVANHNAVQTAGGIVSECLEVFQEMDKIFLRRTPLLRHRDEGDQATRGKKLMERLWWPYIQSKVLLLRSNLEKLKSTLLLMLNVFTYARLVSAKSGSPSVIARQRKRIKDLNRSNENYVRIFEKIKHSTSKGLHVESETRSSCSESRKEASGYETDARSDRLEREEEVADEEAYASSTSSQSNRVISRDLWSSQSSEAKEENGDPCEIQSDASLHKVNTLKSDSALSGLSASERCSTTTSQGDTPKDATKSGVGSLATLQNQHQGITGMPTLPTDKDMLGSRDQISEECLSQQQPFTTSESAKLEDVLLEHLKQYVMLISDLIGRIDRLPEALPLKSRETVRHMLNRAYRIEMEQLIAQHGQSAVVNAEQGLGSPFNEAYQHIPLTDGNDYDKIGSMLSLPAKPSVLGVTSKQGAEKLSLAADETDNDHPLSHAPSRPIRPEVNLDDRKLDLPVIQRVSTPSTVHELLKAGWSFQARRKPSTRLSKRLAKSILSTGVYMKPVDNVKTAQAVPLDRPTHYSIGVNLPNIKEIFSPSFQTLDISSPMHPVRVCGPSLRARAHSHALSAVAVETEGDQKPTPAATVTLPPNDPYQYVDLLCPTGRRLRFPFRLCSTWKGMEYLINEAFSRVEIYSQDVADGSYDLVGPRGEIILKQVWEHLVHSPWEIWMRMWSDSQTVPLPKTTLAHSAERSSYYLGGHDSMPRKKTALGEGKKKGRSSGGMLIRPANVERSGDRFDHTAYLDEDVVVEYHSRSDSPIATITGNRSKADHYILDCIDTESQDPRKEQSEKKQKYRKPQILELDDVKNEPTFRGDSPILQACDTGGASLQRERDQLLLVRRDDEEDGDAVDDLLALWTNVPRGQRRSRSDIWRFT